MSGSAADSVWNRAAERGGGDFPRRGDRALASLLLLHGLAMNGGIHHALDFLSSAQLSAAIDGFSYFGFEAMADWLGSASTDPLLKEWTDETEQLALSRYAELIPDDGNIVRRFDATYSDRPSDFAPLA